MTIVRCELDMNKLFNRPVNWEDHPLTDRINAELAKQGMQFDDTGEPKGKVQRCNDQTNPSLIKYKQEY